MHRLFIVDKQHNVDVQRIVAHAKLKYSYNFEIRDFDNAVTVLVDTPVDKHAELAGFVTAFAMSLDIKPEAIKICPHPHTDKYVLVDKEDLQALQHELKNAKNDHFEF